MLFCYLQGRGLLLLAPAGRSDFALVPTLAVPLCDWRRQGVRIFCGHVYFSGDEYRNADRYYICRLSVVLKASAYTMYKRYLTNCVDSLKPPADGE